MDEPALLSLATACPPYSLEQSDAAQIAVDCCANDERQARLLHRLYETTTVQRRGSVLIESARDTTGVHAFFPPASRRPRGPTTSQRMAAFERSAAPLATRAAAAAIERAGLRPGEVTHLVTVTCTGFVSPGVEHALIARLGLSPGTKRVQVGFMGCHAALNGMQVAAAIARTDPRHRVLLCCVELCSLHFQYGWNEQRLVANALFADGAGAAIIGADHSGPASPLRVKGSASQLIDHTSSDMTWAVGDHGFEMTLSPRVPGLIAEHLRPWVDDFLEAHGLDVQRIGGWCVHAGGPRIVSAVGERLGLPGESTAASRAVLRDHGNMSSATVMFILDRMAREAVPRPWVMLAFGPGLAAEAVLLA